MSSPALGGSVPPADQHVSPPIEPPIARSGRASSRRSSLQRDQDFNRDSVSLSTTGSPVNGNSVGVSELLQRALNLKEGTEPEEIKDGQRTPGSHSRASTDLTAVELNRISPAESLSSRPEEESVPAPARPSASRSNSLVSANSDPSRPRHSSSRRGSGRPYGPNHHQSNLQARISPPHGWNGVSPTSSSDGKGYGQGLPGHSGPQHFSYPQTGHSVSNGGGGGYAFATTTPPFLAHQPRHPSYMSQLSDHSTSYSTGSPYSSSSSSMWYQQYGSAVTTPLNYPPTPLEGGLVYPTDASPESSSDALSAQQCMPSMYQPQYEAAPARYPPAPEFAEPPNTTSRVGPYQAVYFSPPPSRVMYAASTAASPVDGYSAPSPSSTAASSQHHAQSAIMAYPITSTRPAPAPHFEEQAFVPTSAQPTNWRGGRQQQTLVPTQQLYPPPYNPHSNFVQFPNPNDHRRYVPYQATSGPAASQIAYYPHPGPNHSRSLAPLAPSPTTVPPRHSVSSQYSPMSAPQAFSPPSSPPRIYAPPVEIARGVLASTRLREAAQALGDTKPARATRIDNNGKNGGGTRKGYLPKPPAHSPHALWVGNVPSDASHSELWQFFVTRPSPSAVGLLSNEDIDLASPGVESIHLIARSNCAFVNYVSDLHLQHAISISNGLSLRPNDPRCKALLCRVRKEEDESKTGVGAQRVGGIHKAFVKLQQERMSESEQNLRHKIKEEGLEPKSAATKAFEERRQSSSSASVGTTSTTSSFLTKHFEKRWFIMKSHDEADLKLSVESGLWATQPHNEPVLQQAYRTAKEVFLVFSANGSGEWFGYARMSGPISSVASAKSSRPSWGSSGQASVEGSASSTSLSVPSQTIQEDTGEPSSFPPRAPVLFSPSEHRLAQASPSLITPTTAGQSPASSSEQQQRQGGSYPMKLPSEIDAEARREMALEQERMAFVTSTNLHLPPEVAEAARKAATYDSGALKKLRAFNDPVPPGSLRDAIRQVDLATGHEAVVKTDADRDDARKPARSGSSSTWGTPFAIEWVKVNRLPFARTRHIRNSFNGNREIKVSRDGTEVEPAAGQALIEEFERTIDSPEPQSQPLRP